MNVDYLAKIFCKILSLIEVFNVFVFLAFKSLKTYIILICKILFLNLSFDMKNSLLMNLFFKRIICFYNFNFKNFIMFYINFKFDSYKYTNSMENCLHVSFNN